MPPTEVKRWKHKLHDDNPYGKIVNPEPKEIVPKRARANRDLSKFSPLK